MTPQAQLLLPHTQPDVTRKVLKALKNCGHPYLWGVQVQAQQGHVILDGTVPSYYGKQLAQAVSLAVPGVKSLENRLAVN